MALIPKAPRHSDPARPAHLRAGIAAGTAGFIGQAVAAGEGRAHRRARAEAPLGRRGRAADFCGQRRDVD